MYRNILLTLEYDGSNFHGWQRQPGLRTGQGEVERVLSILCAQDISVDGTSRTDAGVHALGQRATFSGEFSIPTENIKGAFNSLIKDGDLRIVDIQEVEEGFHARFNCKGKKYIYRIDNSNSMAVFNRRYMWNVTKPLDIVAMNEACRYILGTHDFKCFQAAGGEEKETTVRNISDIYVERSGDEVLLHVAGDGFLYNMVRIITGTLVEVGLGKRRPQQLQEIIDSKDRTKAGMTAPPQGLYLAEVYY